MLRSVSSFIALRSIFRDFTPLNAIIGFSEIMQQGMFGSLGSVKYEEYCNDIHHSGTYLLGVINDILDMSRIEAGQVDLSVEAVELEALVSEATRIMTPTAREKDIVRMFQRDVERQLRAGWRAEHNQQKLRPAPFLAPVLKLTHARHSDEWAHYHTGVLRGIVAG